MAIDQNANIYAVGNDFSGSPNMIYKTFAVNSNGQVLWVADYRDLCSGPRCPRAIALDDAGNIYATGGSTNAGTGQDWATLKYSTNGSQIWVQRYNGSANGDDEARGILVDNVGNVYVTGYASVLGGGTEIVTIKYAQVAPIQRRPEGGMRLQFPAPPDQSVGFQFSTNFLEWLLLGTSLADSNGIATFDDTNAPLYPQGFYRGVSP